MTPIPGASDKIHTPTHNQVPRIVCRQPKPALRCTITIHPRRPTCKARGYRLRRLMTAEAVSSDLTPGRINLHLNSNNIILPNHHLAISHLMVLIPLTVAKAVSQPQLVHLQMRRTHIIHLSTATVTVQKVNITNRMDYQSTEDNRNPCVTLTRPPRMPRMERIHRRGCR
jgi:hypothetical protein